MTNIRVLSWKTVHACHIVVSAWLSNFCHGFSKHL